MEPIEFTGYVIDADEDYDGSMDILHLSFRLRGPEGNPLQLKRLMDSMMRPKRFCIRVAEQGEAFQYQLGQMNL